MDRIRVISKARFIATLSAPFKEYSSYVQRGIQILYRVFIHYSDYPFPAPTGSSMSEDGLYRGVLLLAGLYKWETKVGYFGPCKCGPYTGSALTYRAVGRHDEIRRMFRFLASPIPGSLRQPWQNVEREFDPITRLPVGQFIYDDETPKKSGSMDSGHAAVQERVVILDHEDERDVDLLDVLLETHPGGQEAGVDIYDAPTVTSGPFRDSFRLILPALPRYEKSLHELQIQLAHWKALVELLLLSSFEVCPTHLDRMFAQTRERLDVVDAMTFAFIQDEDKELDWRAFETVITRSMVWHPLPMP